MGIPCLNEHMSSSDSNKAQDPIDPAKAAFLAALEKKQSKGAKKGAAFAANDKSSATTAGPGASRRLYQRRSGSS